MFGLPVELSACLVKFYTANFAGLQTFPANLSGVSP